MESNINFLIFICFILPNFIYLYVNRRNIIMIYLKIIIFLIYLIFMGILFTKYTSLHGIFLIPYSLLILIEYALFIKKDK